MLILVGTVLAMLLVPLLGGRLSGLASIDLRGGRLVAGALGLQVLAITVVRPEREAAEALDGETALPAEAG